MHSTWQAALHWRCEGEEQKCPQQVVRTLGFYKDVSSSKRGEGGEKDRSAK